MKSAVVLLLLMLTLLCSVDVLSTTTTTTSHENNYLLLCLVDGRIYSLSAFTGELQGIIYADPLLQRHTTRGGDAVIVPALDGKLYMHENQMIQELPISMQQLLENPVRWCDRENEQDCGILTAQAVTSLLALSDNGHLLWKTQEDATNGPTNNNVEPPKLLLQRNDYWIQHVLASSGQQLWNVSLGTYKALDFDISSQELDDDGIEDDNDMPSIIFSNQGRTLTAIDSTTNTLLWKYDVPSALSSVFGIANGGWMTVQVLHTTKKDDVLPQLEARRDDNKFFSYHNDDDNLFYEQFLWTLQKQSLPPPKELPSSSEQACLIDGSCPVPQLQLPAPATVVVPNGFFVSWSTVLTVLFFATLFVLERIHRRYKAHARRVSSSLTDNETRPPLQRSHSLPGALKATTIVNSDDGERKIDAVVSMPPYSRYAKEFEEIRKLGRGGFGSVFECINVLDGRSYAVKKVVAKSHEIQKVLREAKNLAKLEHANVVRYYTSWMEQEDGDQGEKHDDASASSHGHPTNSVVSNSIISEWSTANHRSLRRRSYSFGRQQFGRDPISHHDDGIDFEGSSKENLQQPSNSVSRRDKSSQRTTSAHPSAGSHDSTFSSKRHTLYIQMQLCGTTLADFLNEIDRDVPKALRLFLQVAEAVAYVHSQGLIHRDLKPSNCFLENDTVRVGDFGLSRELLSEHDDDMDSDAMVDESHTAGVGTRSYASPEQIQGSNYDASTDVYSLGILFFELLYMMKTHMERYETLKNLRMLQFPADWAHDTALICSMLNVSPSKRPTAADVVSQVQKLVYGDLSILNRTYPKNVVVLRIETSSVFDTFQSIKSLAEIVEYGMRNGESCWIIEIAVVDCDNLVPQLERRPEVRAVRQVSGR